MSNYVEYGNKIAFHPGYYVKEYIDEMGLTQEDFANRLGTTPKNISYIVRGEQSISVDIANKLSRMMGTSIKYWLNLQTEYDSLIVEFNQEKELEAEKEVFKHIKYSYFRDNFALPDIPKKINEQIKNVREFLNVSSLTVFKKTDMYVNFRRPALEQSEASMIRANIMVQIATNLSLKKNDFPKYDKNKFLQSIDYALTLTKKHDEFYGLIKNSFAEAGVDLIVLPNISGSKINGATKKLINHVMLMVNDRNNNSDSFWFTLFHEIGHIINGDFGISFENELGDEEEKANFYAENALIPQDEYHRFIEANDFSIEKIVQFANSINRDSSIVLGRLQKDGFIIYDDWKYNLLRKKYVISI
ncbi:MAG TPA: HigA family addiction module antitoxin [Bacilli bacterium]|nr:MAG: putative HTH-type transcriptional regulator YddM [Tenericutes bacterium ADurb.BinA124]HNZ50612.1 HigA family addiction module antitoxin [Bacilli bacterium]HPX84433.1 HigA family addiction module antitoxin [Bacilli bacterium]HQC74390.1 HigA family addiction module antitoxin [Bacilli bacterium]